MSKFCFVSNFAVTFDRVVSSMEFAQSGEAALQHIDDVTGVSIILILSDINMPGMTGLELLPKSKAARPDVPVIMITA
jgi:Response regulator containing CheY-like receiver, AAA-type ATPase, and DNA-binding domains